MRLLIIRDPASPLLGYIDTERSDQTVILIQDGVYADELRAKNALVLEDDVNARKIECGNRKINYDQMLDAIFESDRVICI